VNAMSYRIPVTVPARIHRRRYRAAVSRARGDVLRENFADKHSARLPVSVRKWIGDDLEAVHVEEGTMREGALRAARRSSPASKNADEAAVIRHPVMGRCGHRAHLPRKGAACSSKRPEA